MTDGELRKKEKSKKKLIVIILIIIIRFLKLIGPKPTCLVVKTKKIKIFPTELVFSTLKKKKN